ncbi:PAS domain S-box protein [Ensifer sp. BR816]|uniref:PAS domain S-box protein n=1 Tax=Rhizobium sp. (strain BR816) TaxID=1057002 RepID=UPI00352870EC
MLGYTQAEVLGTPAAVLIPDDSLDHETAMLSRILAGDRDQHIETRWQRKDGSPVDISLTISHPGSR